MLSSNLLSIIAMASFALTTASAAALKPRAEPKACTNLLYSIPQCCVPDETGLAEPDCITPASAATADDLKASCSYGDRTEASCCSDPNSASSIGSLCMRIQDIVQEEGKGESEV